MDETLETIQYRTANGNVICVDVSTSVKELLEQSDRQIRSQGRQDRRYLDFVEFTDALVDANMTDPTQQDAADLVIEKETHEQVHVAINELPPIQRRRLLLHFMAHLTYRQIARMEGVNQAAIGRAIQRALRQLNKKLLR